MKMSKREFLRAAGTAGFLVPASSFLFPTPAHAQAAPYSGKIFINIAIDGGIDQSSWTDPRETDRTINTYAGTPAVGAGNIRFAPMGNNRSFVEKYYQQMLVINGISSDNNGHGLGMREQCTGRDGPGLPNVVELFAKNYGDGLPFAWLAQAHAFPVGLRAPTGFPDPLAVRRLALPNEMSATNDGMKPADLQKTLAARAQRLEAMRARGNLPPRFDALAKDFLNAEGGRSLLSRLPSFLPATMDTRFPVAHLGLVAAQAGVATGFQLVTTNGFDTHAGHDAGMAQLLPQLTDLIDFLWQTAGTLGIANRVFMRIFTEFGRTEMTVRAGKEHYGGGGTLILMEANPTWGNRVVGATGPRHQRVKINPTTGAVDPINGAVIKANHVQQALRNYLNLTADPLYDLRVPAGQTFDSFNPNMRTGYPNI